MSSINWNYHESYLHIDRDTIQYPVTDLKIWLYQLNLHSCSCTTHVKLYQAPNDFESKSPPTLSTLQEQAASIDGLLQRTSLVNANATMWNNIERMYVNNYCTAVKKTYNGTTTKMSAVMIPLHVSTIEKLVP